MDTMLAIDFHVIDWTALNKLVFSNLKVVGSNTIVNQLIFILENFEIAKEYISGKSVSVFAQGMSLNDSIPVMISRCNVFSVITLDWVIILHFKPSFYNTCSPEATMGLASWPSNDNYAQIIPSINSYGIPTHCVLLPHDVPSLPKCLPVPFAFVRVLDFWLFDKLIDLLWILILSR